MKQACNMLGLCARAGRLVSGQQAVETALKAGKAKLVLVDAGASDGTKKALNDACRYRGVELIQMGEQALGNAIGRPGRMAAAVTDAPFAERIRQLLTQAD